MIIKPKTTKETPNNCCIFNLSLKKHEPNNNVTIIARGFACGIIKDTLLFFNNVINNIDVAIVTNVLAKNQYS